MAIIVASDLSERSRPAVARGVALAAELSLPLHVVHAVDPALPETVRRAALQGAREMLTRQCEAQGAVAHVEVVAGKPRTEIARYAADAGGVLLVVGRHDETKDALFSFSDTTAGQIVRTCPLPVLVATSDRAEPYAMAVVGVDFSIYARSAIRHARRFAPRAILNLIHAYQIPFRLRLGTAQYLAAVEADARREFDQFLAEDMAQLIRRAGLKDVEPAAIRHESVPGMPYEALTRAVERLHADLLVVGTHGAGGFARTLWGSVATALLENPPCDLLVTHET